MPLPTRLILFCCLLLLGANNDSLTIRAAPDMAVSSFTLIDAGTDQPVPGYDPLLDGDALNLATLPTSALNIRANTTPSAVGSVRFSLNGDTNYQIESEAPYTLAGDNHGDYSAWTPDPGSFTLAATPYDQAGGGGDAGSPLTIRSTVVDQANQPPTVTAGPDQLLTLPTQSVMLAGSASDPEGGALTYDWTQMSGPNSASLSGGTMATLNVSDLIAGRYVFRLTATDTTGQSASDLVMVWVLDPSANGGSVAGELRVWHPVTISFAGPAADEADSNPNPFLDYRLQLSLQGPSGQTYEVPGFFAGDGNGGGSGNVWQVRFAPDEAGNWQYAASFRGGANVAVDLAFDAGTPTAFDGANGTFTVSPRDPNAPGFLKWGRLAYNGNHYLKFADGPYWLKGGTDSPENFFGYAGFDNTVDQGGIIPNFLHEYATHRTDWRPGDPDFGGGSGVDSKGIVGALNYLGAQHVNSIYFLPLNLGGDGQETYPFLSPAGGRANNTHYDVSKLHQWHQVLEHAQTQGVAVQFVLAETEPGNENWLDNGDFGVERKLYFRELVARYGYLLARKWNLSEENDFNLGQLREMAGYLRTLDWNGLYLAVHTHTNYFGQYENLVGDQRFTATSIQYQPNNAGEFVETWRANSAAAGQPWVLDMDENVGGLTDGNVDDLRKRVLYDVYFSGGQIEWYAGYHDLPLGGDMRLEDFRTREAMWQYMWHARRFMQENLPFWEMRPADNLVTREAADYGGAEVFAKPGRIYAIYLPNATAGGQLDLRGAPGAYRLRWFNPRTGAFAGAAVEGAAGRVINLGQPPTAAGEDWVILVTIANNLTPVQWLPLVLTR